MSDTGLMLFVAAVFIIVAGGMFLAVPWWRHYFRRIFNARLQRQEDGSYLAYWTQRGQRVEVYRIDATIKERVLDGLVAGSVLSTALFVGSLIASVAVSVLWPTPLIALAALLLATLAFAPQRRANHEAMRLILTGARLHATEAGRPPSPSRAATKKSVGLTALVSGLTAIMGIVAVAIFWNDPEGGTVDWTGGAGLALILLLVVLPLLVAIFNLCVLWRLHSNRNDHGELHVNSS